MNKFFVLSVLLIFTLSLALVSAGPPTGAVCGNGECDGAETCSTCSSDCGVCVPPSNCGNSIVNVGEDCDWGANNGDWCSPSYGGSCQFCGEDCSLETNNGGSCGDGFVQTPNEVCDGTSFAGKTCLSEVGKYGGSLTCNSCTSISTAGCFSVCGNNNLEPGETCDDGNTANGDGCSSACALTNNGPGTYQCDGIFPGTSFNEACNYGYFGGYCYFVPAGTYNCAPTCGDGIIVSAEQCEGSNLQGASCVSLGYIGGTLGCNPTYTIGACTYNTTGCSNNREYGGSADTYDRLAKCNNAVNDNPAINALTDFADADCQSVQVCPSYNGALKTLNTATTGADGCCGDDFYKACSGSVNCAVYTEQTCAAHTGCGVTYDTQVLSGFAGGGLCSEYADDAPDCSTLGPNYVEIASTTGSYSACFDNYDGNCNDGSNDLWCFSYSYTDSRTCRAYTGCSGTFNGCNAYATQTICQGNGCTWTEDKTSAGYDHNYAASGYTCRYSGATYAWWQNCPTATVGTVNAGCGAIGSNMGADATKYCATNSCRVCNAGYLWNGASCIATCPGASGGTTNAGCSVSALTNAYVNSAYQCASGSCYTCNGGYSWSASLGKCALNNGATCTVDADCVSNNCRADIDNNGPATPKRCAAVGKECGDDITIAGYDAGQLKGTSLCINTDYALTCNAGNICKTYSGAGWPETYYCNGASWTAGTSAGFSCDATPYCSVSTRYANKVCSTPSDGTSACTANGAYGTGCSAENIFNASTCIASAWAAGGANNCCENAANGLGTRSDPCAGKDAECVQSKACADGADSCTPKIAGTSCTLDLGGAAGYCLSSDADWCAQKVGGGVACGNSYECLSPLTCNGGFCSYCGDSVTNGIEQCDDGNLIQTDACKNDCTLNPTCGNGILNAGEECDDNNNLNGDSCDSSCRKTAVITGVTVSKNCGVDGYCGAGDTFTVTVNYNADGSMAQFAQVDLKSADGTCVIQAENGNMIGVGWSGTFAASGSSSYVYTLPAIPPECGGKQLTRYGVLLRSAATVENPGGTVERSNNLEGDVTITPLGAPSRLMLALAFHW